MRSLNLNNLSLNQIEEGRPYYNFINSVKSKETKEIYKKCLVYYLQHYNLSKIDELLSLPVVENERMLVDFLLELKNKDLFGFLPSIFYNRYPSSAFWKSLSFRLLRLIVITNSCSVNLNSPFSFLNS